MLQCIEELDVFALIGSDIGAWGPLPLLIRVQQEDVDRVWVLGLELGVRQRVPLMLAEIKHRVLLQLQHFPQKGDLVRAEIIFPVVYHFSVEAEDDVLHETHRHMIRKSSVGRISKAVRFLTLYGGESNALASQYSS